MSTPDLTRVMSAADITRTTAQRGLEEAMNARALNLEQTRLLFNPSPECDSLGELPAVLLRNGAPAALVAQMVTLCRQLLESNVAEGACEMTLAGLLEDQIVRARTAPLMQRATAKGIAARLRAPLAVLARPQDHDGVAFFRAASMVRDAIAACPREQLLATAVEHHLGGHKFRLLSQLVADFEGSWA